MFKVIKDFPNYEINEDGCVRRLRDKYMIKKRINVQGYYSLGLSSKGKYKQLKLHRLLAENFLQEPNEDLKDYCKVNYPYVVCVNHKDGNKLNNDLTNLEWCSHVDNTKHAWANNLVPSLKGTLNGRAVLSEEIVHALCKFYEKGGMPKEAISKFGVSRSQATKIRAGLNWKHIWEQYNIKVNKRKV